MKKIVFLYSLMILILSLCTSCTMYRQYFGVENRAQVVPSDFDETEAVLARAENSPGAKYCPDKIAQAKALAHEGAEAYWACRNTESHKLLAEARRMAEEAEHCGPQAVPAPEKSPECNLGVSPASVTKGQSANLSWSSQNASKCNIQPDIGPVECQGSMTITPAADTTYTLTCSGGGGKATSETNVAVTNPPPAPTKEELCMTLNIEYDTDKATIKPAYFGEVEKVADFMKKYPQVKGTIEGNTDNVGTAKYNLKLSQRRAEVVVKLLVDKYGIDKSRLSAKGYGLTKPIADNKTPEGRQKNRRTMANFGCVTVEK